MLEPSDKYHLVYAVCRFQATGPHERGGQFRQRDFAVVKVLRSEELAKQEVERLNGLNRAKGIFYFYQETRMDKGEW